MRPLLIGGIIGGLLFAGPASSQIVVPAWPSLLGGLLGIKPAGSPPNTQSQGPIFRGPYNATVQGQASLNGTTCAGVTFRGGISSHTCSVPSNWPPGIAHNKQVLADRPIKLGIFTRLCAAPQSALTPDIRSKLAVLAQQYNAAVEDGLQGIATCNLQEANNGELEQMRVLQQVDGLVLGAIQYGGNGQSPDPQAGAQSATAAGQPDPVEPPNCLEGGLFQPDIKDEELKINLVDRLYNAAGDPNRIGNGSTADAIRYERATNTPVGGLWHTQKGEDYMRGLQRWLRQNPNADPSDIDAVNRIINDLKRALTCK